MGILAYFKYTNFFIDITNLFWYRDIAQMDIFLPVGVSFFTFQSLSYTIDVYRDELKPVSLLDFAFFVTFFPQMVAGPIVRAKDFLPQIHRPVFVSTEDFGRGVFLFACGLFKKAVISDYISRNFVDRVFEEPLKYTGLENLFKKPVISDYISRNFVDRVFEEPLKYTGLENLFGTYGYALQIYCDFSGYTDMAIGIALVLGYHLVPNFDAPYLAPRLFVHTPWRQPLRQNTHLHQPANNYAFGRIVAWRFDAVCFVGIFARNCLVHRKVF